MAIERSTTDTEPLDPLIAALEHVDAWEHGEAIDYSPEGLAFLLRLQSARLGRLSAVGANVEVQG
jgi:hypothetical protein